MMLDADVADDGVLVRYLDGACTDEERSWVEGLDAGSAAARRLWELREADARVTELIADVGDVELPPLSLVSPPAQGRKFGRELRAAGIVLLLAAGAATAHPVPRQWAVEVARGWLGMTPAPVPSATGVGRTTLSFSAAGAVLEVRFEASQADGELVVATHSADDAVVEAPAQAAVLVLPGGLRVQNAGADVGSYRLVVPESVTRVGDA